MIHLNVMMIGVNSDLEMTKSILSQNKMSYFMTQIVKMTVMMALVGLCGLRIRANLNDETQMTEKKTTKPSAGPPPRKSLLSPRSSRNADPGQTNTLTTTLTSPMPSRPSLRDSETGVKSGKVKTRSKTTKTSPDAT